MGDDEITLGELPITLWGDTDVAESRHVEARPIVGDLIGAHIEERMIHRDWLVALGMGEAASLVGSLTNQLRALPAGSPPGAPAAERAEMERAYLEIVMSFALTTLSKQDQLVDLVHAY